MKTAPQSLEPAKRRLMETAFLLLLGVALSACAVPASNGSSHGDRSTTAENLTGPSSGQSSSGQSSSGQSSSGQSSLGNTTASDTASTDCSFSDFSSRHNSAESEPNPAAFSVAENTPVFEQFNFQPIGLSVSSGRVVVETPRYVFSSCANGSRNGSRNNSRNNSKKARSWSITDAIATSAETFDYSQYLIELADPDYETVEVNGEKYQYRTRLEADWIDEQVQSASEISMPQFSAPTPEAREEAVYFDLKTPDGKIRTQQLYTLSELQDEGIGASLGEPRIAGVVALDEAIWFAATTSQGEGENGFASLIRYDFNSQTIERQQPAGIQGDQLTAIAATVDAAEKVTLWLGTMRSGEGNPTFPAHGLVAYSPADQTLQPYTITNSPLVGAIPHQLAVENETLWVATGNGICQVVWAEIETDESWRCWRFRAIAQIPPTGVPLYRSFLAEAPAKTLAPDKSGPKEGSVLEVLWASWEHFDQPDVNRQNAFRYEVVYEPGFEAELSQGGYRVDNEVAQRMARGNNIFWPGQYWHWGGDRFQRALDEVPLNLVGGGPQGLISSRIQTGFSFDHNAIRGDFDLISLKPNGTKVRYYSGWIEGADLTVYPDIVEVSQPLEKRPNPLNTLAADLPPLGP